MKLYQNSTKFKPLLFFETFLKKDIVSKYENIFYDYPINASQVPNRLEGNIEYLKDIYEEDEEFVPIKIHYKEQLESLLKVNLATSLKLIHDRENEILYEKLGTDFFIKRQLLVLTGIRKNVYFIKDQKSLIIPYLDLLEVNLFKLLKNKTINTPARNKILPKISYFNLKPKITKTHIRELYQIAKIFNIIDWAVVSEEQFLNVFLSPNLPMENNIIIFSANNRIAIHFLNSIRPFFEKFTPAQISKSQSFFNTKLKVIDGREINKVNTFLKKVGVDKYPAISEAVIKTIPSGI